MTRVNKNIALATALIALLAATQPATADNHRLRLSQNRTAPAGDQLISEQRAAAAAQAATGGKVLGVKFQKGNRPVYLVKVLLNSKRVKTVRVDARTGAVR